MLDWNARDIRTFLQHVNASEVHEMLLTFKLKNTAEAWNSACNYPRNIEKMFGTLRFSLPAILCAYGQRLNPACNRDCLRVPRRVSDGRVLGEFYIWSAYEEHPLWHIMHSDRYVGIIWTCDIFPGVLFGTRSGLQREHLYLIGASMQTNSDAEFERMCSMMIAEPPAEQYTIGALVVSLTPNGTAQQASINGVVVGNVWHLHTNAHTLLRVTPDIYKRMDSPLAMRSADITIHSAQDFEHADLDRGERFQDRKFDHFITFGGDANSRTKRLLIQVIVALGGKIEGLPV